MTEREAQIFKILATDIQILDLSNQKSKYNAKSLMGINRQESKKLRQQLQAERRKREAEERAKKIREEMERNDYHV